MRNVFCFIFARGGSKGVPRKNIRKLAGKPLISYTIETGLSSDLIDRVFVSTDDLEIAGVAKKYGAEVPFIRPRDLARDDSPEWLAWQHAIMEISSRQDIDKMDIFVALPATAPLRNIGDVDACINTFINNDTDIVITVKNAARHPSFNMVVLDENDSARLVMQTNSAVHRRQDAAPIYDMTTVAYVSSPDFILNSGGIFEGRVTAVKIPDERALDIDSVLDFEFAEFMMSKQSK